MKIASFDKDDKKLSSVPQTPSDQELVYQIGQPFQLSSTEVALFCNIRRGSVNAVDVEAGNDLVIFNDISEISTSRVVKLNRWEIMEHHATGKKQLLSVFPCSGGFVPYGAKQNKTSKHPYAGTGFSISRKIGYPVDLKTRPDEKAQDVIDLIEIQQYRYDGNDFKIFDKRVARQDEILPGYDMIMAPMRSALPDGDDLICGMSWKKRGEDPVCGMARWKFVQGAWIIASLLPMQDAREFFEPSLVRIFDGSLLFTARAPEGPLESYINIWHSVDGGKKWDRIICTEGIRSSTPLSVNITVEGNPFIVGNPYREVDSKGVRKSSKQIREELWIWPVSLKNQRLESPIKIRNCSSEFPPSPSGSIWRADHPTGCVVRLADNEWHCLLNYRVLEENECRTDAPITPYTGCYIVEVFSDGEPVSEWEFE